MVPCKFCGLSVDSNGAEKVVVSFRIGVVCEDCFMDDPMRVFHYTMIHNFGVKE